MRLQLLGTGGFHPSENRHTACYLLPELGVMLDAGTATFRVPSQIETPTLDVLLTHAHLDHVIGLTYLLGLEHNGQPVVITVHAEPAVLETVQNVLFHKSLFPILPPMQFKPLTADRTLASGVRVRTVPLEHPGGSLGLRLDYKGKSLGYVTDTVRQESGAIRLLEEVDLLLHEAYFMESENALAKLTGHCTAAEAAQVANELRVKKLVLIHQNPRADEAVEQATLAEAKQHFEEVTLAQDQTELTV